MKLPVYRRQESPLVDANMLRLSVGGAGALGRTIAQSGAVLESAAGKLAYVEEQLEESRQAVATSRFLSDLDTTAQGFLENPDTTMPAAVKAEKAQAEMLQATRGHLATIPDERVRNRVEADLTQRVSLYTIKIRHAANVDLTDAIRADAHAQAAEALRKYVTTRDPVARAEIASRILGLYAGLGDAGVFSQLEAQGATQKFRNAAEVEAANADLLIDPAGVSRDLLERDATTGEYKNRLDLLPDQRRILSSEALQRARVNEETLDRAQKKKETEVLGQWEADFVGGRKSKGDIRDLLAANGMTKYTAGMESFMEQAEGRTLKADAGSQRGTLVRILNQVWDAENPADRTTAVSEARAAFTAGEVDEDTYLAIRKESQRQDDHDEQLDWQRFSRAMALEQREEARKRTAILQKRPAARALLRSVLPSATGPMNKMMAPQIQAAQHLGNFVIEGAVDEGNDPQEALRTELPSILMSLYGDTGNTIASMTRQRRHRSFDDLVEEMKAGAVPKALYEQELEAWHVIREMVLYQRATEKRGLAKPGTEKQKPTGPPGWVPREPPLLEPMIGP